jgi:hypothetical protein
MVNEGKARLFKNSQGRYMIYLPVDLAQDSMFPFKVNSSINVRVAFKHGDNKLTITEWQIEENSENEEDL